VHSANAIGVTFHGVRGSTPCHSDDVARYGGNTSCVSLAIPGHDPVLFDMGTGMRYFGMRQPTDRSFRGHVLLSHMHWDHTQGLPFFTPILCPGSRLDVYGPAQDDGRTVAAVMRATVRPPLFPILLADFPGVIEFHDVSDTDFEITADVPLGDDFRVGAELDPVRVMARIIPHVGATCGYRVTWNDHSVAYMSDHQMPYDGSMKASDSALELAAGADLLIHDAQYTVKEFEHKSTWGHCTVDYAVWLAAEAGVKRLALFHHDPNRCDDAIDRLLENAQALGERRGVEVFAAAEGLTLSV
jgi:phosphoribosyl 1,2-cyclic phosphodiesterase